ncbi:MAG: hypothetical protein WAV90_19215 [Gordonia amarae]
MRKGTDVTVYINDVAGPFSDRTARLTWVNQFTLRDYFGSTAAAMGHVLGQVNNSLSADFVTPVRAAIAARRGAGELREGDMVQVGGDSFMVTAGGFARWFDE